MRKITIPISQPPASAAHPSVLESFFSVFAGETVEQYINNSESMIYERHPHGITDNF
jgi:hypothetical protein